MQANVDEVQAGGSETFRSPVSVKRDEERLVPSSRILVSELEKECERLLRSAEIPTTLELEESDSELSRISKLRNQTIRKFLEMVVGIQGGASISQKRTRFPQKTTDELLNCIKKQSSASLPTVEQRRRLSKSTGLSSKQVKDWFTNYRRRRSQRPNMRLSSSSSERSTSVHH
mmetsp:Transcript_10844/g.15637  ORF Transcript_10844/g.15637 Transcript_10844/m.15637 type:complete len:173 (-) Transcript_10844:1314-1832(-)